MCQVIVLEPVRKGSRFPIRIRIRIRRASRSGAEARWRFRPGHGGGWVNALIPTFWEFLLDIPFSADHGSSKDHSAPQGTFSFRTFLPFRPTCFPFTFPAHDTIDGIAVASGSIQMQSRAIRYRYRLGFRFGVRLHRQDFASLLEAILFRNPMPTRPRRSGLATPASFITCWPE